ncbi:MAG TPA: cbb3-type cytochrome c oxidase subunit II [Terracidiphilus sp.]|nr:cbb3-type cytochrome c oxidase subunit II [Terracidiphilus sp.]
MRSRRCVRDWRGVILVAAVYVYFLIFAQFAFLAILSANGIQAERLKGAMVSMAFGGILFSLLTPRIHIIGNPALRLRIGLCISVIAALLSLCPLQFASAVGVAFLIGTGLGIVTLTLVTHLAEWCGEHATHVKSGLGVGLGYLICNIPTVFAATPKLQALLSALVFVGVASLPLSITPNGASIRVHSHAQRQPNFAFLSVLIAFTALIWLDSAAFYIIQHNGALKAGTWEGNVRLWSIAGVHFVFAVASALLLRRHKIALVLTGAFAFLGAACAFLAHPSFTASARLFYPAGVSLYSVALVLYPSSLSSAQNLNERARQAGWLYAIAGWIGSALGIGMGQNLGHIPIMFVGAAGLLVLAPISIDLTRRAPREVALLTSVIAISAIALHFIPSANAENSQTAIERGKRVYIAEGCISCHSQYVRPNTSDELMWGPASTPAEVHHEKPPLIGNRRQGPDLAEVGLRRSPAWLREHLIEPRALNGNSIMPSYAYLFEDRRGSDLVAYLTSLQSGNIAAHLAEEHSWHPAASAMHLANLSEGERLYWQDCATCHESDGDARKLWSGPFNQLPLSLNQMHRSAQSQNTQQLAQIIKFGIHATDMPGHEWLSDRQVASISLWIRDNDSQTITQH